MPKPTEVMDFPGMPAELQGYEDVVDSAAVDSLKSGGGECVGTRPQQFYEGGGGDFVCQLDIGVGAVLGAVEVKPVTE